MAASRRRVRPATRATPAARRHVLPDVLQPGLDIVFCGTAAGAASARARAYYAGPGNAFWPTLHAVGLTPRRLAPAEFRLVTRFGLGLTDLAKTVSGNDSALPRGSFDASRVRNAVLAVQPRILAFTSKRAAREFLGAPADYGRQRERVGGTLLYVLPSPSGQARRHWDLSVWRALAALKSRRAAAQGRD